MLLMMDPNPFINPLFTRPGSNDRNKAVVLFNLCTKNLRWGSYRERVSLLSLGLISCNCDNTRSSLA